MKIAKSFILFWIICTISFSGFAKTIIIKTVSQEGFTSKYNLSNKEKSGICIDIIRAIEKIDPEVKFVGLESSDVTARIEESLGNGVIDCFFGLARTDERANRFILLEPPLYSSNQCLFVRNGDSVIINSFDDVKKLGKAGVILVIRGTTQEAYLKSIGGLIIDNGSVDTVGNLKKLMSDRGRFYYGSDINTIEEINYKVFKKSLKVLPVRFQPSDICIAFSKQSMSKVVVRIQKDLKKLYDSGKLTKIYQKYTK